LHGQEYQLLDHRRCWGEDRVYFRDSVSELHRLPASWTSVVEADPLVVVAAGRAAFRLPDLLRLVELLQEQRS
jgi:hypothetical protein